MIRLLDFPIRSNGQISKEFIDRNIFTFFQATLFVKQLPYGRNADKHNLATVFTDNCGTCSTKHALIKRLAVENNFKALRLMVGLFKMNGRNMPKVSATLCESKLYYIPEAHCYLRYEDQIIDLTNSSAIPLDFMDDLIEEIEISPDQITDFKVNYHRSYLKSWLDHNKQINFTLDQIWEIREQCILKLC